MLKKHPYMEQILQVISLTALIILLFCAISLFRDINGTARVINYAGIVRGCTQRTVKLELAGTESEELMQYLDEILKELQNGGDSYNLVAIDNDSYQNELKLQEADWLDLKERLRSFRENPSAEARKKILDESESYWTICDKTVSIAESYSEELTDLLCKVEFAIIVFLIILSIITIHRSHVAVITFRKNARLSRKAYEDSLTGVKNRQYFDEFFEEMTETHQGYTFVFIDIDNLKYVNDTFGHEEGDRYIRRITDTIRSQFRATDVMFRIGGDEFALFLDECKESIAAQMLESARAKIIEDVSHPYEGSFSYGTVYVGSYEKRPQKDILEESDEKMYQYKKDHKKQRKD